MESYDEFLSKQEYEDMMKGETVIPVVHKYEILLKKQVRYPDSVSQPCATLEIGSDFE
jgi:hypothetical protein